MKKFEWNFSIKKRGKLLFAKTMPSWLTPIIDYIISKCQRINRLLFGVFKCPICGKRYRSYWYGNDITDWGIDICDICYKKIDAGELNRADYPADLNADKRKGTVANLEVARKCCPVCGVNPAREVDFKLTYWDGHNVAEWSDDICQICYDKIYAGELPFQVII